MKSNLQCSLNSQRLWADPYKFVLQSPKSDGSGKTVKRVNKHFLKAQISFFIKHKTTFTQWEQVSRFCQV